jgi:hypothetical protein
LESLVGDISTAFGDLTSDIANEFSASYSTAALSEASFGGLFMNNQISTATNLAPPDTSVSVNNARKYFNNFYSKEFIGPCR